MNLEIEWKGASGNDKWDSRATIKIFSDERKFEEYQKTLKNKNSKAEV